MTPIILHPDICLTNVSQRLVEGYLLRAAQRSDIFAHILIWHLQVGNSLVYLTEKIAVL